MQHAFRFCSLLLALALMAAIGPATARAEIILALDGPSGPLLPGESFSVDVLLLESGGSVLTSDGIFAASFQVAWSNATLDATTLNPGFDITSVTPSSGSVVIDLLAFFAGAVFPEAATPEKLLLGSLTFTAGGPGTIVITAGVADPALDNFVTGSGVVLDDEVGQASLRLQSVPEPASAMLLALGLAAGLGRLRQLRRRRGA